MSFLSMDDFKGHSMNPSCSAWEALLEVSRVASLKLHREISDNPKESVFVSMKTKKFSNFEQRKHKSMKRRHSTLCDNKDLILLNERLKKKKLMPHGGANPPPELPKEFKKKIEEMRGSELSLLIQKSLYSTDLSSQHNRLSLPLNQINNPHFLGKEESLSLTKKKQALDVLLIEPSLHTRKIVLGRWDLTKSSSYVLRSSWMKVAKANGLKVDDVVQVWSFRVGEQLCMALVKVPSSN